MTYVCECDFVSTDAATFAMHTCPCGTYGTRLMAESVRRSIEPSTADLLRLLCDGWDDFGDDARDWQKRMDALVAQAREHLAPTLPAGGSPVGTTRGEK